ncbi:MAG: carbamoyltransferase C-terminal domain-containing protein, partial [Acidobacteriota bacterium]|nr:carbamoyltransferase C-terminal domain-containing protein [Acidobacteriota bacterium]
RSPFTDAMRGSLLGPRYSNEQVRTYLDSHDIPYQSLDRKSLPDVVASLLTAEKIVGLHQGRMEFGPRALGARSILADPRSPRMQSIMNLKIKYREGFRPFAPSVMREHVSKWFEFDGDSPYMLLVANVVPNRRRAMTAEEQSLWGIDKLNVPRSEIPAVTHVDYSARIQTVHKDVSPLYWSIIEAFYRQTNCPVIVNTSFNVRGEPIVCTPEDAYRCFMRTDMDALVIGDCLLNKTEQRDFNEEHNWQQEFPPD